MFALLPTLLLAFTALAAPSSNYPTTTAPLLGFSYPKPFLGLDDGFSNPAIGYVSFIPGFHACGTLSIFSIEPGVEEGDWGLLPRNSSSDGGNATVEAGGDGSAATEEGGEMGLWERYDEAPTQLIDTAAVEGHILAWARGSLHSSAPIRFLDLFLTFPQSFFSPFPSFLTFRVAKVVRQG